MHFTLILRLRRPCRKAWRGLLASTLKLTPALAPCYVDEPKEAFRSKT